MYEMLSFVSPISITAAVAMAVIIVLSCIYDIRNAKRERQIDKLTRKLRYPNRPQVTVVIYDDALEFDLETCISGVNKSSHQAIDLLVIGRPPGGLSNRAIGQLKAGSKNRLSFYSPRTQASSELELRRAYAKSLKGEFVVVLSSTMSLGPQAIERAVAWCQIQKPNRILKFSEIDERGIRIATLPLIFLQQSKRLICKSRQLFGVQLTEIERGSVCRSGFVTRRSEGLVGETITSIGVSNNTERLLVLTPAKVVWFGIIVAGLIICTVALIAASLRITPVPFLLILVLCCFWFLSITWLNAESTIGRKLTLSMAIIPGMFIMLLGIVIWPILVVREEFAREKSLKS